MEGNRQARDPTSRSRRNRATSYNRTEGMEEVRTAALVLLVWAALAGRARAQSVCKSAPVWQACEIEFELNDAEAARHSNPYWSVELRAEFRAPKGNTFRMPGFWDGERKLKIRVAPTAEGNWDFRVSSNIERFNGQTGSFTATAATTTGFVVPFNVHHFKYAEVNKAHLWMGDRKSTRLNSSHSRASRMPSSA